MNKIEVASSVQRTTGKLRREPEVTMMTQTAPVTRAGKKKSGPGNNVKIDNPDAAGFPLEPQFRLEKTIPLPDWSITNILMNNNTIHYALSYSYSHGVGTSLPRSERNDWGRKSSKKKTRQKKKVREKKKKTC
jgi:hypothetical protein